MKKIFGLVLALVMIVSVIAVVPAFADGSDGGKWNVMLNEGINLNYYEGDVKVKTVNVAAKEMAASQTVSGKTTSVQEYLTDLTTGDYGENTKALARALLNYGAAAYEYFAANKGYVGTPVDGDPVDSTDALLAAEAPEIDVEDPNGIFIGASLVLDGTMQLRFYFEGTGLKAEYQDNNQTSIDKDGYCYFDAPVMPYAMSESVTIVVGDATVTYAPINYLQAKADDATLSEMVASIYAYGVAAEAYYVSDGCEHNGGITIEVITHATMLTEGKQNNYCDICNVMLSTTSTEKTTAKNKVFTDSHGGRWVGDAVKVSDALNGQHFYPTGDDPDGNDLFVEFSMLWDESLLNSGNSLSNDYFYFGNLGTSDGTDTKNAFMLALADELKSFWCKYTGGFEIHDNKYILYGPEYEGNPDFASKDSYPSIGKYGWHRIGIQYHQTTDASSGKSDLALTLYVDGVKLSSYIIAKSTSQDPKLLYNAYVKDGKIIYSDSTNDALYVIPYMLGDCRSKDGTEMNFTTADLFVTVGDGFVLNVSPATNPTANDELGGTVYFQLEDGEFCAHDSVEYETVREATTAQAGIESGTCPDCDRVVSRAIPKVDADIWTLTSSKSGKINDKFNIVKDVLKGDHFYPTKDNPEGNDLLVEWSFLWEKGELKNLTGSENKILLTSFGLEDNSDRSSPFFILLTDNLTGMWCPYEGGFETDSNGDAIIKGPPIPDWEKVDETVDDYPFIGENGWHRIGVRIHQEAKIENNEVVYTCIATLYLDGDIISQFYFSPKDANRLYTAEIVDGELVYSDIADNRYVSAYVIDQRKAPSGVTAYLIDADVYATCGKDFVLNVKPVKNPEEEYSYVKGTKFESTTYFEVVND